MEKKMEQGCPLKQFQIFFCFEENSALCTGSKYFYRCDCFQHKGQTDSKGNGNLKSVRADNLAGISSEPA